MSTTKCSIPSCRKRATVAPTDPTFENHSRAFISVEELVAEPGPNDPTFGAWYCDNHARALVDHRRAKERA